MEIHVTNKDIGVIDTEQQKIKLLFQDGKSIIIPIIEGTINCDYDCSYLNFKFIGLYPNLLEQYSKKIHVSELQLIGKGWEMYCVKNHTHFLWKIPCNMRISNITVSFVEGQTTITELDLRGETY